MEEEQNRAAALGTPHLALSSDAFAHAALPWCRRIASHLGLARIPWGCAFRVLTGRKLAYGYTHVERFLSQLAHAGGAETFTHAFGEWLARLWPSRANFRRRLQAEAIYGDHPVANGSI